nr:MAG TPA: Fn3 associated [Caudoviricetes sp.]
MAKRNLYYTVNGTAPSTGSTVYSSPFEVNHGTTVKAIAESEGLVSGVSSAIINITVPTPVINAGAMGLVTLSNVVGTARYTIDGSDVTASSPAYTNSINITKSGTTLKVKSYYRGAVSAQASTVVTFVVFTPTVTVNGSTFSISRSPSDQLSTLQYKYGESGTWVNYTAPVTVSASQEVWARAIYYQESSSSVIHYVPTPPVITRPLANYISITTDAPGASIYYTTNGSTPTSSSTKYTGNIPITATMTVKAIVVWHGQASGVSSTYVHYVKDPVIAINSAGYVFITGDGYIHYTKDGSTPTSNSPIFSGGFLAPHGTVIKAMGIANGVTSNVVTKTVVVNIQAPRISIYQANGEVTLTPLTTDAGTVTRYTVDGTEPTGTNGTTYTGPFFLRNGQTMRAVTILSTVRSPETTQPWAAAPLISGGDRSVTIDSQLADAKVYYTTNGMNPTTSSASFLSKGSFTVSGNTTVKAMTVFKGYQSSTWTMQVIISTPPIISITKAGSVTITSPNGGVLFYTLNGVGPTKENGSVYTGTFVLTTGTAVVKAVAYVEGWRTDVAVGYYIGTPIINVSLNDFTITSQNPQARTYYDSVEPTEQSPSFTGSQKVITITTSMTMYAASVWNGFRSGTAKLSIEIPPAPALTLRANGVPGLIRLIALDPIRYTTDGSTPNLSSPIYESVEGYALFAVGTVLKAIAVRNNVRSAMIEGTVI